MPRVARTTADTTEVTTRRSGRSRAVVNYASQVAIEEPGETTDPGSESPLTDLESEGEADTKPPPPKKRRKVKVAVPVVYDIPPVETKTSTFKGKKGVNIYMRTPVHKHLISRSLGIRRFHEVDTTCIPY